MTQPPRRWKGQRSGARVGGLGSAPPAFCVALLGAGGPDFTSGGSSADDQPAGTSNTCFLHEETGPKLLRLGPTSVRRQPRRPPTQRPASEQMTRVCVETAGRKCAGKRASVGRLRGIRLGASPRWAGCAWQTSGWLPSNVSFSSENQANQGAKEKQKSVEAE